jgi:hypothetical protein
VGTRTREDTWLVTVSLDGVDLGVWDGFTGGEGDSEEQVFHPGGMAGVTSLGGQQTFGNVTISRNLDALIDWPRVRWYYSRRGTGRIVIGRTPLSSDAVRSGSPLTFLGTLKAVTLPDHDSDGTDVAMLEFECTIDGVG